LAKKREINLLTTGIEKPDGTNAFNKNNITNESYTYGIFQLEQRLDRIRDFTAINYSNLTSAERTELKRIRRGAVYQNADIRDSRSLFEASKTHLSENINPMVIISIDSISILQAQEAESDWSKVNIGEKVDIYVPDLKIDIEAEIQEINIDFQNYKTGLTISTSKNYDKSFGKYFADVYRGLKISVLNDQKPREKRIEELFAFENNYDGYLEDSTDGDDNIVGVPPYNNTDTIPTTSFKANEIYIDPRIDQLVDYNPTWLDEQGVLFPLYGELAPGTATLTSGGLYIKDEAGKLRVKLTARDGLVAEQFKIDLQGNAVFSGTLAAGIDTTGLDGLYASPTEVTNAANAALASANLYTDGEIAGLQSQIDGSIDTYFAEGTPLPIVTTYNQDEAPGSASEGETWYDTNDDLYYVYVNSIWVIGGNANIDTLNPWPNDNLEFYQQHVGDLYYDNTTGYAYRFTKTGTADPDELSNYKWVQISDSAATSALAAASTAQATADGKVTVFTASSDATYGTIVDDRIQDGDILMPTENFDAIATNHVSLNNNYSFVKNDTYVYLASTKRFEILQDVENKKTGSVSGWLIDAENIESLNGQITLHSDSEGGGFEPYIAMNKTGYDDGNSGLFMGYVADNGNYPFKMDMGNPSNFLR
jgi:hypothetical protein